MGNFDYGVLNKMLDAVTGRTTYTAETAFWVKLHTGDPGGDGTGNPATVVTRQQGTFGTGANLGAISNTAAVEWTSYAAQETITYVSFWNTSTTNSGTFLGSDALTTGAALTTNDTFRIPVGDLDLSIITGI